MKKWKVMLSSNCQFTLAGLEHVIKSHDKLSEKTDVVSWPVSWLGHEDCIGFGIDILILVLDSTASKIVPRLIDNINRWNQVSVILLTPSNCNAGVNHYLMQMVNARAVYSSAVSVATLQNQLIDIVENRVSNNKENMMKLSAREQVVISSLLKGVDMIRIASELGLSYKTVSHYKRTALLKLGVSSLHGVMILGL
ncbi:MULTISPECIES: response regulator transcription factor [unclassified Serratia (in: enterobacteria)]|uniref:response regulator transcription factor n=1 Tax=unclassified Serratia (in: enterobacteria) TaxID=2647522 RepID=UPI0030768644